jgi:hypothetical protein
MAAARVRRVFELAGADRIVRPCPEDFSASQAALTGRRAMASGTGRGRVSSAGSPPARLTILEIYC